MVDEEFESVPRITLDEEDREQRHGRRAMGGAVADKASKVATPRADKRVTGLAVVVLLAVAGIVWLYQGLQQSTQQLAAAAVRIEQLEARLISTDTTLTQSEVLLADKLVSIDQLIDTNKTEIRKLWGLAGDVQRKALDQAKTTNEQQNITLKKLQEQQVVTEQQMADQQAALNRLLATTQNAEASAREAVQRMEISQEKVGVLESDVKALKQVQSKQELEYSKRIAAMEDTAKSTDVFRRNTQEELRKLREELIRQSTLQPKSGL
jgi:hypothetical protein